MAKKILKNSKFLISHSRNTGINNVINNPNCTIFGERCDQPFTAFYVWEKFFVDHGEGTKRFLELGCDVGGTSTYFLLCCIRYDISYAGFDMRDKSIYNNNPVKALIGLKDRMNIGNLYGDALATKVRKLIRKEGKTLVFCDCIDKPWEFKMFAPVLKSGDIIAVHDWDRAIKDEWVEDTINAIKPYKLLYEDERIQLNTLTKFILKK